MLMLKFFVFIAAQAKTELRLRYGRASPPIDLDTEAETSPEVSAQTAAESEAAKLLLGLKRSPTSALSHLLSPSTAFQLESIPSATAAKASAAAASKAESEAQEAKKADKATASPASHLALSMLRMPESAALPSLVALSDAEHQPLPPARTRVIKVFRRALLAPDDTNAPPQSSAAEILPAGAAAAAPSKPAKASAAENKAGVGVRKEEKTKSSTERVAKKSKRQPKDVQLEVSGRDSAAVERVCFRWPSSLQSDR